MGGHALTKARQAGHSRQDSCATSSQPSVPDVQQRDDSNIASKIARQTVTQAAFTDEDESAMDPNRELPPRAIRGTLNEWRVYIKCYNLDFGGSVGHRQVAMRVSVEKKCLTQ